MTTEPYQPVFQPALKRAVPTTGIGTVRLCGGPLVRPATRAWIEAGCRAVHIPVGNGLDQLARFAKANKFQFQPTQKQ